MAQWKQTREPYIDVHEKIKTAALNPRAGEDLIIGCALITDAGPSTPTLITSQSEFLSTYTSRDLTKDYIKSLNDLYDGDDHEMAETMWLNAYRLAGANTMLVVRASKSRDNFFTKSLSKDDNNVYLLRDGQLLKSVPEFKIVVDIDKDSAEHTTDGWCININGVGVIGNRNDDNGPQYDYFVKNLGELVDYLNDTNKFFCCDYSFFEDSKATIPTTDLDEAVAVVFKEVYVGKELIDTTDERCPDGLAYVVTCEVDWDETNPDQKVIDLNGAAFSGFTASKSYATNRYNSSTDLKVRIRRFNHDAVVSKELTAPDAYEGGNSPYIVLGNVLDTFTKGGTKKVGEDVLYRDFYEIAILDPSVAEEASYFNIGNILGRGDMSEADLNDLINMVQVELPDDMASLGLGYYGYLPANQKKGWAKLTKRDVDALSPEEIAAGTVYANKAALDAVTEAGIGDIAIVGKKDPDYYVYNEASGDWVVTTEEELQVKYKFNSLGSLRAAMLRPVDGEVAEVGEVVAGTYYMYKDGLTVEDMDDEEIYVDLTIDPRKYKILNVNDNDILRALDEITQDEVYVTEGLADLGCTSPMVQSYMVNMAINDNYFYPISTVNSTNYLSIANSANRISKDHYKLYLSAPWDVDTGTVGWKFYASPGTLYWESVARNRGLDREFAPVLGQINGIAQYQNPVVEFNKKTRQLLLSKKINTVLWNTQTQAWNMNDNYTKQSEDNIMSDDGNSRLMIRISKAMPILLRQFIGRRISPILWKDMKMAIEFWFNSTIIPMSYSIDAYQVTIDETNNPVEVQRRNSVVVLVEIRYNRCLKYVTVDKMQSLNYTNCWKNYKLNQQPCEWINDYIYSKR